MPKRSSADVAGDAIDRADDVAGEESERAENGDGDDGEDDAVLRHRLAVFALVQPLEGVEELLHVVHLSSRSQGTPCGTPTSGVGRPGEEKRVGGTGGYERGHSLKPPD